MPQYTFKYHPHENLKPPYEAVIISPFPIPKLQLENMKEYAAIVAFHAHASPAATLMRIWRDMCQISNRIESQLFNGEL